MICISDCFFLILCRLEEIVSALHLDSYDPGQSGLKRSFTDSVVSE